MRLVGNKYLSAMTFCLAAALPGTSALAEDYRLTGVMGSDTGKAFAVIEYADGRQQLLSEGSALGPGYVKRISTLHKTVLLAFPDGEVQLRLTGSGSHEEYREEYTTEDYSENVNQQSLDQATVVKLLALASDPAKYNESDLALQLNELLGLSARAQVVAYDNEGADSTQTLLAQIAAKMPDMAKRGTYLGTIAVSDQGGLRRVYLMAGSEDESTGD